MFDLRKNRLLAGRDIDEVQMRILKVPVEGFSVLCVHSSQLGRRTVDYGEGLRSDVSK
jgi:hypothetical protein